MTQPMTQDDLRALLKRLTHLCRFNGAVKWHYSVAEHTSIMLEVAQRGGESEDVLRAVFVHDLPEAVLGIGDVTRDVKTDPAVAAIVAPREAAAFERIRELLPFSDKHHDKVKVYDRLMAVAEVERVAEGIAHDDPADYSPVIHGYAARRIQWRNDFVPRKPATLERWCGLLWPGSLE